MKRYELRKEGHSPLFLTQKEAANLSFAKLEAADVILDHENKSVVRSTDSLSLTYNDYVEEENTYTLTAPTAPTVFFDGKTGQQLKG